MGCLSARGTLTARSWYQKSRRAERSFCFFHSSPSLGKRRLSSALWSQALSLMLRHTATIPPLSTSFFRSAWQAFCCSYFSWMLKRVALNKLGFWKTKNYCERSWHPAVVAWAVKTFNMKRSEALNHLYAKRCRACHTPNMNLHLMQETLAKLSSVTHFIDKD